MRWRIGDVTVTKIVELEATGGTRFILPQATREAASQIKWMAPHFMDDDGRLKMSIHALIIETPGGRRMIVDTCLGNDKEGRDVPTWNNLAFTHLLQGKTEVARVASMRAVSIQPESLIACTGMLISALLLEKAELIRDGGGDILFTVSTAEVPGEGVDTTALGIVASAKQDNRRIILVVNGYDREPDRKAEAARMIEWGFRAFGEFKLFDAGENVGEARVYGGDRMYVPLTGNGPLSVVLPKQPANQKLKGEIVYRGPLMPPITKGDAVATLRVTSTTGASSEVQLYAATDVAKGPMWRRGLDSLLHIAMKWMR